MVGNGRSLSLVDVMGERWSVLFRGGSLDFVGVHDQANGGQVVGKILPEVLSSHLPEDQVGDGLHGNGKSLWLSA